MSQDGKICPDESLDAGSDSRETRLVVVVRSVVSVAVAAGVGHSVGSHGSVGPGFFSTSPALYRSVDTGNTRQKAWQHERTRTELTRMAALTYARRVMKLMKMATKRPPIALKLVRSAGMAVTWYTVYNFAGPQLRVINKN